MTRREFAESIRIGHNLGNALECIEPVCNNGLAVTVDREVTDINGYHDHRIIIKYPDGSYSYYYSFEEIWSNVPITQEWFNILKSIGVQAIRVPMNLSGHLIDGINHTIDPLWLKRIREVINMCISAGLKCVLTLHTDFVIMYRVGSYRSLIDTTRDPSTDGVGRLMSAWKQMAEYVNDISVEDLAFELTNEFRLYDIDGNELATYNEDATDEEKATYAARLNKHLFDAIRSVGGNAAERFLLIGGYGNNPDTCPDILINSIKNDMDDKCIITACYYTPWEFTVSSINTTWEYCKRMRDIMDNHFNRLLAVSNDNDIPLVITEFGIGCDEGAMAKKEKFSFCSYIFTVMNMMKEHNVPAFIWDPGYILRRDSMTFGLPFYPSLVESVANGTPFDPYNAYLETIDNYNIERLTYRDELTLEDIQALDNLQNSEEV